MYTLFKIAASLALKLYCKKNVARFQGNRGKKEPTLIASNHPNSFFDAIIIAVHYPEPIYFLARGDAFKNPIVTKFLRALHLIPIYRLSEGKENLNKNQDTFKTCLDLLHENKTILIFSEGICINEWNLRPLKKGTARLALMAMQDGLLNLRIQPTNVNYSSFHKNPKEVEINFNLCFGVHHIDQAKESIFYNTFNTLLKKNILNNMVVKEDLSDIKLVKPTSKWHSRLLKVVIAFPALIGFIFNYWIYYILKRFTLKKTKNSVFYDSILFGMLLLLYPIIVSLLSAVVTFCFNLQMGLILFFVMPISAWFYKIYKSY